MKKFAIALVMAVTLMLAGTASADHRSYLRSHGSRYHDHHHGWSHSHRQWRHHDHCEPSIRYYPRVTPSYYYQPYYYEQPRLGIGFSSPGFSLYYSR